MFGSWQAQAWDHCHTAFQSFHCLGCWNFGNIFGPETPLWDTHSGCSFILLPCMMYFGDTLCSGHCWSPRSGPDLPLSWCLFFQLDLSFLAARVPPPRLLHLRSTSVHLLSSWLSCLRSQSAQTTPYSLYHPDHDITTPLRPESLNQHRTWRCALWMKWGLCSQQTGPRRQNGDTVSSPVFIPTFVFCWIQRVHLTVENGDHSAWLQIHKKTISKQINPIFVSTPITFIN